jgi:hypothetical protein
MILNILKGVQFEFLPRAPFYIDALLRKSNDVAHNVPCLLSRVSLPQVRNFRLPVRFAGNSSPYPTDSGR